MGILWNRASTHMHVGTMHMHLGTEKKPKNFDYASVRGF